MEPISLETVLTARKNGLIVIDVQNEFCHPEGSFARSGMDMKAVEKMVNPLLQLISAAHACNVPVVFIRNVEDETTDSEA